ncbi:MAG: hypothetical protein AAGC55_29650, partial [Myxococcota bacterium]
MTNSAKQTNDDESGELPQATALAGDGSAALVDDAEHQLPVVRLTMLAMVVLGCLVILYVNRWNFGPPVVFLWIGWLSVILVGRYLWVAGMSAAMDSNDGISDEDFWRPVGRRDELMVEKRILLKALKEIEFDHQTGKMSDEDAEQMTKLYRARAIAVIKALDSEESTEGKDSIDDRIEREVKARITVAKASDKGKAQSKRAKKNANKAKANKAKAKVKDDAETEAKAKAKDAAAAA